MSDESNVAEFIGGPFCKDSLEPGLIPMEAQILTERERYVLWELFTAIGDCWQNVFEPTPGRFDSSNLRSTWLEFMEAKTTQEPSYVGEYSNAATVVDELVEIYGKPDAFDRLFLANGIPPGLPLTRLAHAKRYVVDEFIRVQVTGSGFKPFGGRNYKGYLGGSRYTIDGQVRSYKPESEQT